MTQRILFTLALFYQPHLPRGWLGRAKSRRRAPGSGRGNYGDLSEPMPGGGPACGPRKHEKMVAYERINIPLANSYSPGIWADGHVGAVDLHRSQEAPEGAFAGKAKTRPGVLATTRSPKAAALGLKTSSMYILTAH